MSVPSTEIHPACICRKSECGCPCGGMKNGYVPKESTSETQRKLKCYVPKESTSETQRKLKWNNCIFDKTDTQLNILLYEALSRVDINKYKLLPLFVTVA